MTTTDAVAGRVRTATCPARWWLGVTTLTTIAALVVAALLAPPGDGSPGPVLVALVFVGPAMHVASTGWLATITDVRACARSHPWRLVVVPALLVLGAPVLVPMLPSVAVAPVIEGVFAWQFLHFAKQNVGMATLASTSHGAGPLHAMERRCVVASGCCGIAALVARPGLLGLDGVPSSGGLFALAASGFTATVLVGLVAVALRPRHERPTGTVVGIAVALGFSAPLFLVASPYGAVGGMTIAHGLQYLVLLGLVAVRPGEATGRAARVGSLLAIAVVGGLAVQATALAHGGIGSNRVLLGAYLGLVAAHFVVDAGVWRLRDATSRTFVTGALPDLVPATRLAPGTA